MSTSAPGVQAVKEFVTMSIADRTMQTTWEGPLASGEGTLSEGSSAALDGLQVTWASRTEQPGGKTSPRSWRRLHIPRVSRWRWH